MKSSTFTKLFKVLSMSVLILGLTSSSLYAQNKKEFKIAWSIYVGWMPWYVINSEKIINKWADKYGIKIDLVQINDYVESINQYTAGKFDGAAMVNMDALSIPAASGIDSTALIMGDYSNGNDAIISKTANSIEDLKGTTINLLELSVSHYLLARALEKNGLSEKDVSLVNTSDSDIVSAYTTDDVKTVVTWKPQVSEIMKMKNTKNIYDSSKIPAEIMDMMVVNTKTLRDNPNFGKALVGAWYEMMDIMTSNSKKEEEYKKIMAKNSGTNLDGFNNQLKTTFMYYNPEKAVEFVRSPEIIKTMKFITKFTFDHGLYGDGASDENFVGIEFPNGKIIGDKNNIKLRFDDKYMEMAAKNSL
jgi:NitT/TauT family transport system substrate-binding protein